MFNCCCHSSARSYDVTFDSADSAEESFICGKIRNACETLETRDCWTKFSDGIWTLSRTLTSAICRCKKENPGLGESTDYLLADTVSTISKTEILENKHGILQNLIASADTASFHAKSGVFRLTPNFAQLKKALQDPEELLVAMEQGEHNHILHAGVIKAMLRNHCLTEAEKLSMVLMAGLSEQEIRATEPTTETTIALLGYLPEITDAQFPESLQRLFPLFRKIILAQLELPASKRATALSLANSISGSLVPFTTDGVLTLKYPIVLAAVLAKAIESVPAEMSQKALSETCYNRQDSSSSSTSQEYLDVYL